MGPSFRKEKTRALRAKECMTQENRRAEQRIRDGRRPNRKNLEETPGDVADPERSGTPVLLDKKRLVSEHLGYKSRTRGPSWAQF
jgi:hypothetical protein